MGLLSPSPLILFPFFLLLCLKILCILEFCLVTYLVVVPQDSTSPWEILKILNMFKGDKCSSNTPIQSIEPRRSLGYRTTQGRMPWA